MKVILLATTLMICTVGQIFANRLNNDPSVIYLENHLEQPLMLKVIKKAPAYSDLKAEFRLGFLAINKQAELVGISKNAYRVRAKGTKNQLVGWVSPAAFSHEQEDFKEQLKKFYERQIIVNKLIANKALAIGFTLKEVEQSRGKPTKTSMRKTANGNSGSWEYIDYEEVKHYNTVYDARTRRNYRQLSHVTREEKGKTIVEFKNGIVEALEESESELTQNVRIVIPPIIFRY